MTSISAVRDGLKTRLATISGLNAYDTVPATINPPAAVVFFEALAFDGTFANGQHDMEFTIRMFVQVGTYEQAQDNLDGFLATTGATSVKAAIEADMSLGGVVSYARVVSAQNYVVTEINGIDYMTVEFMVEVCT